MDFTIICANGWQAAREWRRENDVRIGTNMQGYMVFTGPRDLPRVQGLNRHTTKVVIVGDGPMMTMREWLQFYAKFSEGLRY